MSEGFALDLQTASLFFRFCARYKVSGREDRVAVMREICRRGRAKYLRDVEMAIEGKSVLRITRKRGPYEN